MARHPSAIKRHRQSLKRRTSNRDVKSKIRTLLKSVRDSVEKGEKDSVWNQLKVVNRELDKAVSKGVLKRNTASRKLSRLARLVTQGTTGPQAS